jgi:hypothetical protein
MLTSGVRPALAQRLQQRVRTLPVVRPAGCLDRPPFERHSDEVGAEGVESPDALLERSGPELEPGVVLDADPEAGRGGRRARQHGRREGRAGKGDQAHDATLLRPEAA